MSRKYEFENTIKDYSRTVRIRKACKLLRILDDLAWELLALHANNQHLGYSLELSRKIPKSHAAKAFLSLRTSMGRYELVRIASLWDSEDQFGINIPNVVALIDDPKVLEKLENDEYARHAFSRACGAPMEDWAEALSKKSQKEFANERKSKLSATIKQTIPEIEAFRKNGRLRALQNARNKHLAHNLTTTDLERRKKNQKTRVPKLRFGDETFIIDQTVSFIETLHLCVCGTNAIAKESAKAHSRNASDLWSNCIFQIPK